MVHGLDKFYEAHGEDASGDPFRSPFRNFYYTQFPKVESSGKPVLQYVMMGLRWEDIKSKDSPRRMVKNALELMFGPGPW